jgi:hypothetical protein
MRSDNAEGSDFGALANDSTILDPRRRVDLAHRNSPIPAIKLPTNI